MPSRAYQSAGGSFQRVVRFSADKQSEKKKLIPTVPVGQTAILEMSNLAARLDHRMTPVRRCSCDMSLLE